MLTRRKWVKHLQAQEQVLTTQVLTAQVLFNASATAHVNSYHCYLKPKVGQRHREIWVKLKQSQT